MNDDILVGVGTFMVDEQAMRRKLGQNKKKIWMHRMNLVWSQFGFFVTVPALIMAGTSYAGLLIYGTYRIVNGKHFLMLNFDDRVGVFVALIIVMFVVHLLVLAFWVVIWECLSKKYGIVRDKWNLLG